MTILHNNKEWQVITQPTQSGQPPILFYVSGRDQMTQDQMDASVNRERKKKATDHWELKYNGKVEASGQWIICDLKRKELMNDGNHKKGRFEIV